MEVLLRWARAILTWGAANLSWGNRVEVTPVDEIDFETQTQYAFEIEFPEGIQNFWTGQSDLSLGGRKYIGMNNIVSVSNIGGEEGRPHNRITLSFTVIDPTFKRQLLQDPGRVPVTVRLAYSNDGGNTYQFLDVPFRGIASGHRLVGSTYSINIVDESWNTNNSDIFEWSNDGQRRRFPTDLGFEHLPVITEGIQINWPT